MLFKILKLFGLDVPANIEAAKASLERRVERAAVRAGHIAQETAIIAVLSAAAMVISAMAVGVGLIALYRFTADAYGDYAGLSAVGVILVAAAAVLIAVTAVKAKSLKAVEMKPSDGAATTEVALDTPLLRASGSEPHASEARTHSWTRPETATLPAASASDLVDPLAFFLSKYVRFPTVGNPVVDELIGNLRATAHGSTDEAIDRAADVIRHGNRSSLVFVLTGTAFLAWLLTQNSRR